MTKYSSRRNGPDVRFGLQHFTGREGLLNELSSILVRRTKDAEPVICIFGQSGVGKTTLCRRLRSMGVTGSEPPYSWAYWDLSNPDSRQPERALFAIRTQLMQYGASFPSFDYGYMLYKRKSSEEISHAEESDPLGLSPLAGDVLDLVSSAPYIDIAVKVGKLFLHAGHMAYRWWTESGHNIAEDLQMLERSELRDELPKLFGADIERWLSGNGHAMPAIIFDTYESLQHSTDSATDPESWVKCVAEYAPNIPLLMFGRHAIQWRGADGGGDERVGRRPIRNYVLDPFTHIEARRFLESVGVNDASVQDAAIQFSGLLPLGLEMAALIIERRSQQPALEASATGSAGLLVLRASDLPTFLSVYRTLTRHLTSREQDLLNVLAVPRYFDGEIFKYLQHEFMLKFDELDYIHFCRLPFIASNQQQGRYEVHALMRGAVHDSLTGELVVFVKRIHKSLCYYYRSKIRSDLDKCMISTDEAAYFVEALYHGVLAGVDTEFKDYVVKTALMAKRGGVDTWLTEQYRQLLGVADLGRLEFALMEVLLGQAVGSQGREVEALKLLRAGYNAIFMEGEADLLKAWCTIWIVSFALKVEDLEEATLLCEAGIRMSEQIEDFEGLAYGYSNLGMISGRKGDRQRALTCYLKSLHLSREYGLHMIDIHRNNYAFSLSMIGEFDQAEALHQENILIKNGLGRVHSAQISRANIAMVMYLRGNYLDAALIQHSVREYNKKAGRLASWSINSLHLARSYVRLGRFDEARRVIDDVVPFIEANQWRDLKVLLPKVMCELCIEEGALRAAEEHAYRGLEIAGEVSRIGPIDDFKLILGRIAHERGQFVAALEMFREASVISRKTSDYPLLMANWKYSARTRYVNGQDSIGWAETQRALAMAELIGSEERKDLRATLRMQRLDGANEWWGAPTDRIFAIDREYASLVKRTLTDRMMAPVNLSQQRELFLKAFFDGERYAPQFVYSPAENLPCTEWKNFIAELELTNPMERIYCALAAHQMYCLRQAITHDPGVIDATTTDSFGGPDDELVNEAVGILNRIADEMRDGDDCGETACINSVDACEVLLSSVSGYGVDGWRSVVEPVMSARISVSAVERLIRVRKGEVFSVSDLQGLVAHEVGVHVLRGENGAQQGLDIFRFGLPGYIETEEGLAIYRQIQASGRSSGVLQRIALRVLAAHWAKDAGFSEVFERCLQYTSDRNLCFSVALRTKRGFRDVTALGAHMKDIVYLRGYLAIQRLIDTNELGDTLPLLYVGKVGLGNLVAVKRALHDGWLRPAKFLPASEDTL